MSKMQILASLASHSYIAINFVVNVFIHYITDKESNITHFGEMLITYVELDSPIDG